MSAADIAADLGARADAALASATPLGRGAGRRDGGAPNKIIWTPSADRALAAFSAAARGVAPLARALEASPQACLARMAALGLPRPPSAVQSQHGVRRAWSAAEDAVLRGACAAARDGAKRATVATLARALGCREEAVTKRLRVLGLSLRGRATDGKKRKGHVSKPQVDVSPFAATIPCIRCRTPFDSPHRINVRGCPRCHDIWAQRTGLDA